MHWYIFIRPQHKYRWASNVGGWNRYTTLHTSFEQVSKMAKLVGQNKHIEKVHITTNKNWKP